MTLDAANNFPQHPIRTDGPFLVWTGLLPSERAFHDGFSRLATRAAESLRSTGWLRGDVELAVLEPADRSRLRWYPCWDR